MRIATIIITAAFLAGCSAATPTLQTGPDAEKSFDGLVRVDNARFRGVWVDPDINFSRYSKVMGGGATYQFRAVKDTGNSPTSARMRNNTSEFFISDDNRAKLEEETAKIFDEELSKSTRFTETDQKGPDVLILRGALHDIVSNVPPEYIGRSEIYITSVGEATLVIEGVDSLSGEVVSASSNDVLHSVPAVRPSWLTPSQPGRKCVDWCVTGHLRWLPVSIRFRLNKFSATLCKSKRPTFCGPFLLATPNRCILAAGDNPP